MPQGQPGSSVLFFDRGNIASDISRYHSTPDATTTTLLSRVARNNGWNKDARRVAAVSALNGTQRQTLHETHIYRRVRACVSPMKKADVAEN